MAVSASTSGSRTTTPAGTNTNQRRVRRWKRGASRTASATAGGGHDRARPPTTRAASSSGPAPTATASTQPRQLQRPGQERSGRSQQEPGLVAVGAGLHEHPADLGGEGHDDRDQRQPDGGDGRRRAGARQNAATTAAGQRPRRQQPQHGEADRRRHERRHAAPTTQPAQSPTAATSCTAPLRPSRASANAGRPTSGQQRPRDAQEPERARWRQTWDLQDLPTRASGANVVSSHQRERRMTVHLTAGAASGIGSLPHTDARAAAEFVLERLPDLPAIPSLPQRSPAETMLAQAAVGVRGVSPRRRRCPRGRSPAGRSDGRRRHRPRPRCLRRPARVPRRGRRLERAR